MNRDTEDAVLFLEDKRALMAAQPPSQAQEDILRALDEVIAEYRAAPE